MVCYLNLNLVLVSVCNDIVIELFVDLIIYVFWFIMDYEDYFEFLIIYVILRFSSF